MKHNMRHKLKRGPNRPKGKANLGSLEVCSPGNGLNCRLPKRQFFSGGGGREGGGGGGGQSV